MALGGPPGWRSWHSQPRWMHCVSVPLQRQQQRRQQHAMPRQPLLQVGRSPQAPEVPAALLAHAVRGAACLAGVQPTHRLQYCWTIQTCRSAFCCPWSPSICSTSQSARMSAVSTVLWLSNPHLSSTRALVEPPLAADKGDCRW